METPYIKIPTIIQDILAHFRTMFESPKEDSDRQIIAGGYTVANDKLGPEKILNFHVSLVGKWKMINLVDVWGVEKSHERLMELRYQYVKNGNQFTYMKALGNLYRHSCARDFKVQARNFDEGIPKLFILATENYPSDEKLLKYREKGIHKYYVTPILIC